MRAAFLFALFAAIAEAQTGLRAGQPGAVQQKEATAHLQGHTTDGLGAPLRGVEVLLRPSRTSTSTTSLAPQAATSDATGSFSFDFVAPGSYLVSGRKAGYLDSFYGARLPGGPGTAVTLSAGQSAADLNLSLTAATILSGKILDEDGDPVARVHVDALEIVATGGMRRLQSAGSAASSNRGEFRIMSLKPGRYYLRAGVIQSLEGASMVAGLRAMQPGAGAPAQERDRYVASWYPNAKEMGEATMVRVIAGRDMPGMNIRIEKVPTFQVSGTVAGQIAQGKRIGMAMVHESAGVPIAGAGVAAYSNIDSGGSFQLAGLTPGNYLLMAVDVSGLPKTLGARRVAVGDRDLDDVSLNVQPLASLKGVVTTEGTPAISPDGSVAPSADTLSVSLSSTEGIPGSYTALAKDGDRSFVIGDIPPGSYQITVSGGPDGAWLKSVKLGGRETAGGTLMVSGGTQILELTLSLTAGQISGTVQMADQNPAPSSIVTVVPEPAAPGQTFLYKKANADQNGAFTLNGLAPGTYRAYSWDDIDTALMFDTEFLKAYESRGVRVTIKENDAQVVTLTEISGAMASR